MYVVSKILGGLKMCLTFCENLKNWSKKAFFLMGVEWPGAGLLGHSTRLLLRSMVDLNILASGLLGLITLQLYVKYFYYHLNICSLLYVNMFVF